MIYEEPPFISQEIGDYPVQSEEARKNAISRFTREELLHFHFEMVLIRKFEEKTGEMYTRAKIGGYTHLNIGEEGTVVGALSALQPQDYVFSSYREHGHAIAKGVDPKRIMAELFGKETGTSKGRGGSMHIFDMEHRFLGGYAIVGGHLPLAVGVGMAINYRNTNEVAMAILGDGATNIGSFHESLNMASLWNLPVIFLCVNNQYGMGTRVDRASALKELYEKACAYNMETERVDGMDAIAMRQASDEAVRKARENKVPVFIEAVTYRYRGHSMADPARYRTEEEVKWWMARDPIINLQNRILDANIATKADFEENNRRADKIVEEAVEFAERSPEPNPADLYRDIYADERGD